MFANAWVFATLVATDCDWKIRWLGWAFTLFFVFLGSSAAIFGPWLETSGLGKRGSRRPAAGAAPDHLGAWRLSASDEFSGDIPASA
jgi:hypothetical protein